MRNKKINICSLLIALSLSTPTIAFADNESVQSRILNGEQANKVANDLLPWQAAMLMMPDANEQASAGCGAVVISDFWLVTAAHCAQTGIGMSTTVVAGTTLIPNTTGDAHSVDSRYKFNVVRKIIHPHYNGTKDLDHDIALLKVDRKLTSVAKPIKIATVKEQATADNAFANTWNESAYSKANLITSGWGLTESTTQANELMVVKLAGIPDKSCDTGGYPLTSNSHFVCADSNNPDIKKDACRGDSGGPLIWQNPERASDRDYGLRVVGVTSSGPYCENKENGDSNAQFNGLYTELATYYSWVEQVTGIDFDSAAPADYSVDPFEKVREDNPSDKVNIPSSGGGSLPLSALAGLTLFGLLRRNK
ncbi:trypsin-like serine protease [Photobacterium nomapromontoriensis]|uniref:trypsin-like serine protease n=1 Tax=Photobacterium nomapromontoriensis TaxID=2910237 RepID=UPI003D101453